MPNVSLMTQMHEEIGNKQYLISPIGRVVSPFRQKFGTPRQPGLVPEVQGWIELLAPYDQPAMLHGLAGFSHLWVIFHFHACAPQGWRARVRPPRLGGNRSQGVLASRSPFRPNHLGLSVVELLAVETHPVARLQVAGIDILDGSPVFDIKPYLPYTDAVLKARGGFAATPPPQALDVRFTPEVAASLADAPDALALIRAVIALDPRPAYRAARSDGRDYGMRLGDREVKFQVVGRQALVTAVITLPGTG